MKKLKVINISVADLHNTILNPPLGVQNLSFTCSFSQKKPEAFVSDLQDTTLALEFRVTVLEENGGDDGNSSVTELEVRVETLEGTSADHETRIAATESDLTGREFLLS